MTMSDIELDHTDQGSGSPALVLIHGFSSGREDWQAQVDHFAARHRVVAPALRAHGGTPRGTAPMTIPQLATDCIELVRAKGIDSAVVGGHSMGTRVALEMARQAPDLVRGLLLLDGSNTALAGKEAALESFDRAVAKVGYPAFARALFEAMFFDPAHAVLADRLVQRALAVPDETAHELYRNMVIWDGDDAPAVMQAIKVPALVMQSTTRGADNVRRTLEPGETGAYETLIARFIKTSEIVEMPGLGHFVTYEAPDQVNEAIDAFLDKYELR
jgi:pimeloyl-ACP methyl ester carboxylesterase